MTELLNERFVKPLKEWSRKKNTLLRIQCYGTPAAALSSNAYADLTLDSLALELGAAFLQPQGASFGSRPRRGDSGADDERSVLLAVVREEIERREVELVAHR